MCKAHWLKKAPESAFGHNAFKMPRKTSRYSFQIHLFSWTFYNLIFLHCSIKFYCVYVLYFQYPFLWWWTSRLISCSCVISRAAQWICRRQTPLIHTLDSLQIIETFCLLLMLIEFKVKDSTASLLFLAPVTTRRCLASLLMLHSTPVSFDVLSCSLLAFAFHMMSCWDTLYITSYTLSTPSPWSKWFIVMIHRMLCSSCKGLFACMISGCSLWGEEKGDHGPRLAVAKCLAWSVELKRGEEHTRSSFLSLDALTIIFIDCYRGALVPSLLLQHLKYPYPSPF